MDLNLRRAVLNTLPARELLLGSCYVFHQPRALYQTLVLLHVEEYRPRRDQPAEPSPDFPQ